MAYECVYQVCVLPVGGKRKTVARFADKIDAVNYACAQSVGKYKYNHSMLVLLYGKKVVRYKEGVRV